VDEGTLGVHKIELVVHAGEHLSDGGGVGDTATGTLHLGEVTTRDHSWWLVVDTTLETGRAPVDELDGALGLDGGNGGVDVLRDDITTVHHTGGHVLTVTRITLGHHVSWLETGVGDLGDGEGLVVGLLGGDDRRVGGNHEVNAWVWHEVGLELGDIDVEGTVETKGGSQGGDDLSDETVEVGVGRTLNVETTTADIVEGLVIEHDGNIGVLEEGVGGEDSVVWLDDSGGDLRGWVGTETELGLLTVVDGKTLKEEGTETGTGTTSDGVEAHEALKASTLVGELANAVEGEVDDLLTDGVVTAGVVVGSILLAGDELLRVVELTVGTGADLIDHGWLEIEEDGTWDVLASTSLREEGVEGVVTTTDGLVRRHLAIRLDTVLKAVELPATVTDLATALADMDRDTLAHC